MGNANQVDEMLMIALDRWSADWMNRQMLSAAMARQVRVVYAWQPTYPRGVSDLWGRPRTSQADGVTIRQLPSWMNTHFEDAHCHRWLSRQIKRQWVFRRRRGLSRGLMLWDPSLVSYLDCVPADVTCCYIDDFFEGLPAPAAYVQRMREQQQSLLRRADVVFVTWRGLAEVLGIADRAVLLPHGVDYELYSRAARDELPLPDDLPRGRPIVGYAGALNTKVDLELLEKMAERLPVWNIVLVGHRLLSDPELCQRFQGLLERPNFFHLGLKSNQELPGYLQGFDVCMMCYRVTEWTLYGLPLKMFQYFATGKPIVSMHLPSLEEYRPYMEVCMDHDAFIEAVAAQPASDTPQRRQQRMDFAARNTWDHRARTVLDVLARVKGNKQQRPV